MEEEVVEVVEAVENAEVENKWDTGNEFVERRADSIRLPMRTLPRI